MFKLTQQKDTSEKSHQVDPYQFFMQYLTFAKLKIVSISRFFTQSAIFSVFSMLQPDAFATNWGSQFRSMKKNYNIGGVVHRRKLISKNKNADDRPVLLEEDHLKWVNPLQQCHFLQWHDGTGLQTVEREAVELSITKTWMVRRSPAVNKLF